MRGRNFAFLPPLLGVRGSWARRAFLLQAPSGSFRLLQARSYHAHVRRARTRTERDLRESTYEKTVLQLYLLHLVRCTVHKGLPVCQYRQSVSSQPAVIRPSRALFLSCSLRLVYHSTTLPYHRRALPSSQGVLRPAKGPALAKGERPLHCRGGLPWGLGLGLGTRPSPLPPGLAPHLTCNLS